MISRKSTLIEGITQANKRMQVTTEMQRFTNTCAYGDDLNHVYVVRLGCSSQVCVFYML